MSRRRPCWSGPPSRASSPRRQLQAPSLLTSDGALRRLPAVSSDRNAVGGLFQCRDVDLAHLQHRLGRAVGAFRVWVADELRKPGGDDLPGQAEPIFEPAALTLLAA